MMVAPELNSTPQPIRARMRAEVPVRPIVTFCRTATSSPWMVAPMMMPEPVVEEDGYEPIEPMEWAMADIQHVRGAAMQELCEIVSSVRPEPCGQAPARSPM